MSKVGLNIQYTFCTNVNKYSYIEEGLPRAANRHLKSVGSLLNNTMQSSYKRHMRVFVRCPSLDRLEKQRGKVSDERMASGACSPAVVSERWHRGVWSDIR